MAFTWDTKSDFGVDYGGVPSYDWGATAKGIDWDSINDMSYGSSERSSGTDFASKALEALNKAVAYKTQNSNPGTKASSASATVEQVRPDLTIITPAPKQKISGGSSGGGLLGSLGSGIGLAGTALGVFGPLGPAVGALAGNVASRATGL